MATTGSRARAVTGVIGELLLTGGLLVVGFVAWALWGEDPQVGAAHAATVARLEQQFRTAGATTVRPRPAATTSTPPVGQPFAVITIPRFDDDPRPVLEGTTLRQLADGVGHLPGSALPGRTGNFATAGHRVTHGKPYRHIDRLRPGDPIVVETDAGWAVYRFVRSRIVEPRETAVWSPVPDRPGVRPTQAWMTLVACHPPFSARLRYVAYAELDRVVPHTDAPPAELGG